MLHVPGLIVCTGKASSGILYSVSNSQYETHGNEREQLGAAKMVTGLKVMAKKG